MGYPYGLEIDDHCLFLCPEDRRIRCFPGVRHYKGLGIWIVWPAHWPEDCDHPNIVEIETDLSRSKKELLKSIVPIVQNLRIR